MVGTGDWFGTTVNVAGALTTIPDALLTRTVKEAPLSEAWALVSV